LKILTIGVYSLVAVLVLLGVAAMTMGPELAGRFAFAVTTQQVQTERARLGELQKNDTLSPLFRAVTKAVMPAVVEVRVEQKVQMQAPDLDEFFGRNFGDEPPFAAPGPRGGRNQAAPREFTRRGLGSGVVVNAREGYVLTNYHVAGDADTVSVVLPDGRTMKAEWVRGDSMTDLAIVKIKPDRLIEAPLGDSDAIEVGDWVLAIGSPEGLPQTVTSGIISAKGRNRPELRSTHIYQSFIQTDAAINHGNSGGPLVNTMGEVIGINTAIISRTGVSEGIGLAIPSNMAKFVMGQLIANGKVIRGYLGIRFQDVTERLAESYKLPNTHGVLVTQVGEGGPAEKAGMKVGDFIVAVGGKETPDGNTLRNIVASLEPGQTVGIDIYRDGAKKSLSVAIVAQPDDMAAAFGGGPEKPAPGPAPRGEMAGRFGIAVATLDDAMARDLGYRKAPKGVAITRVMPGSDADEQGLAPAMAITDVDGTPVATAEQFAKAIEGKDTVRLRVLEPSGAAQFVVLVAREPQSAPASRPAAGGGGKKAAAKRRAP
jgi:serine protease Do